MSNATKSKSSSRAIAPKVGKVVKKTVKKSVKVVVLTPEQKLVKIGIDAICARISNCEFLSVIAKDCDVSRGYLTKWLSSEENQSLYAHAREAQADKMAEDILTISDDGSNDTYETEDGTRINQDVIARSRLRVDARKWLAAKMAPKKYGDKLAVGGSDDMPAIALKADVTLNPGDAYLKMLGKK
jgi:hypothetical protein